jgi:signal transduction histidine kinase
MGEDDIDPQLMPTVNPPRDESAGEATHGVSAPTRTAHRKLAVGSQPAGDPPARGARRRTSRVDATSETAPGQRRAAGRARSRESGITGLGERAHLAHQQMLLNFLPDPFVVALPALRQALLNRPFEEGLTALCDGLVAALAPAVSQIWIAEPAPWMSESARVGGRQLVPALRLRARARATTRPAPEAADLTAPASVSPLQREEMVPGGSARSTTVDPLVQEVAATRRPVLLHVPGEHPLAATWKAQLSADEQTSSPALGTAAGFPLTARGRLLGVLAVGTVQRLNARQLAALAEISDLTALAADREQLLGYSRGQEALSQTVVRHAPVAMAVLAGPEHTFALTNPTVAMLLGVESDADLTGRRLRDVLPGRADSLITSLRLSAVLETGEPQAMIELPIHYEHGITYWNVTSTPLADFAGGGVLIAAVDVTRQVLAKQRAQDAAEVAQERIGQMMTLHATSLAVASQLGADPRELLADILRRSIVLLNARAGTVYARLAAREALQVIVCQGLRGDYTGNRIRIGEGLAGQVALTGKGLIVDDYRAYPYRAAIYDNELFRAVIAVPLVHHGQVIGVLDILDDAERRAFTDDDLWLLDLFASQAAQAMENARIYVELEHAYRKQRELDRLKDDFIATASHELRTPLTGVQGFLDLLLEYPGSRDEPLALDFMRKAADSAQELANISERLLQTSRLDTGRLDLHVGPVRLNPVVEEVMRSFRELRQAQGATHDLAVDVPSDVYVEADLGRLKEVLDNLIGNAVKYSPHGGRITVRCVSATLGEPEARYEAAAATPATGPALHGAVEDRPTIVLSREQRHGAEVPGDEAADATMPSPAVIAAASIRKYHVLLVTDEGMGIAEQEQQRLFGRFSRTESARASQIRGTGLGLYICRQVVRAMEGDVWLRASVPGRGSTFAVALPAAVMLSSERALIAPRGTAHLGE